MLGAQEVFWGDLRESQTAQKALADCSAIYHICSNMNPDELVIGRMVIQAAVNAGVKKFVYHSVLHPQVEDMPHHWHKMQVEQSLFSSGLTYVILQPSAYMQNIQGYWKEMVTKGRYTVPYQVTSRQSLVDLQDVAQAATLALTGADHDFATYELCGRQAFSAQEIAGLASAHLGRAVTAYSLGRSNWEAEARQAGMPEYTLQTLLKMFVYYEAHDFVGNANVLEWLLGRQAATLEDYLDRLTATGFSG